MTQDERWNMMWTSMMDFFKENKRRPSKYKPEERDLHNWVKYNCKRMRSGKLPASRLQRLEDMLNECERLKRINQYQYKHEETQELFEAQKAEMETA